jgi:hypothetical protein
MPIASNRAEWDEGLRTVRQFNDLLRVLPPLPQSAPQSGGRRNAAPSRPLAPAGRSETPSRDSSTDAPIRQEPARHSSEEPRRDEGGSSTGSVQRPPAPPRNGLQAPHYQR